MHAQLIVHHHLLRWRQVRQLLVSVLGPHDDQALDESPLYRGQGEAWRALPLYASQRPDYRIICMASWDQELQVFVETDRGDLRRSAASVWDAIRSALHEASPAIVSAEILDFGNSQTVLAAQTGLRSELRRRETWQTLVAGVASIVVVMIGYFGFARDARPELIAGAAPSLTVSAVTMFLSVRDARAGRLRWPE